MFAVLNYGSYDLWQNYHKVTFDGPNRIIRVNEGVTELDIKVDVFSDWKEWVITRADNASWLPAIRSIGGDPTVAGQTAGDIYFLQNGWKLYIDLTKVKVTGTLFSDDFDSAYFDFNGVIQFPAQVSSLVSGISATTSSGGTTPAEVWTYSDRTLTQEVASDAPSTSAIAAAVWGYITRTLTSVDAPTLAEIWSYSSRTLTTTAAPSASATAAAVWNATASDYNTAGTTGELLNDTANLDTSSLSANIAAVQTSVDAIDTTTLSSNIAAVANSVSAVQTTVNTIDTNVDTIDGLVRTVDTVVDGIDTNVDTINTNVNTINTNVNTVNTNLNTANVNINTIDGKIDTIDTNVDEIETIVRDIDTSDLNSLSSSIAAVQTSVDAIDTTTLSSNIAATQASLSAQNATIQTSINTAYGVIVGNSNKLDTIDQNVDDIETTTTQIYSTQLNQGNTQSAIQAKVVELWRLAGLDASNVTDITDTSITVGGITISISAPDNNTTRLTRS